MHPTVPSRTRATLVAIDRNRWSPCVGTTGRLRRNAQSIDIRQVGRELGVLYVLEGSVRRSGDRVRIAAQLIECASGTHRWAERYDRRLEDMFAVQDEVARGIVVTLAAHVNKAEAERALLKPPATWQAYDYYMRAAEISASYRSSYNVEELQAYLDEYAFRHNRRKTKGVGRIAARVIEQLVMREPLTMRALIDDTPRCRWFRSAQPA